MFAHALIEHPETGKKYQRGDKVPADFPDADALLESGVISKDPYTDEDRRAEVVQPDEVEINGVVYRRAQDSGDSGEDRS